MASTSETGHNKNVANFSSAYQILEEMGAIYNPSNENLLLTNLDQKKISTAAARILSRGNQNENNNKIKKTMDTQPIKPGPKRTATSTGKPDLRQRDNKKTPGNTPSLKPSKSTQKK